MSEKHLRDVGKIYDEILGGRYDTKHIDEIAQELQDLESEDSGSDDEGEDSPYLALAAGGGDEHEEEEETHPKRKRTPPKEDDPRKRRRAGSHEPDLASQTFSQVNFSPATRVAGEIYRFTLLMILQQTGEGATQEVVPETPQARQVESASSQTQPGGESSTLAAKATGEDQATTSTPSQSSTPSGRGKRTSKPTEIKHDQDWTEQLKKALVLLLQRTNTLQGGCAHLFLHDAWSKAENAKLDVTQAKAHLHEEGVGVYLCSELGNLIRAHTDIASSHGLVVWDYVRFVL